MTDEHRAVDGKNVELVDRESLDTVTLFAVENSKDITELEQQMTSMAALLLPLLDERGELEAENSTDENDDATDRGYY